MNQPRPYPATRFMIVALQVSGALVATVTSIIIAHAVHPHLIPRCSTLTAVILSIIAGIIAAGIAFMPFQFFAEALTIGRDIAVNVAKLAERQEPPARTPAPHDTETEAALHRLTQSTRAD